MLFPYSDQDLLALKQCDEKMAEAIDIIGKIEREIDENFYQSLIHQIIGQQISNKALETIYQRLLDFLSPLPLAPQTLAQLSIEKLQACGISKRKAETILTISKDIYYGKLDLLSLKKAGQEEIFNTLLSYKGIGRWTVEMVLIFGLQRMDVFSFGDQALKKGLMILYGLEKIGKDEFDYYKNLFSPYGTLASLYLWQIASNPGLIQEKEES